MEKADLMEYLKAVCEAEEAAYACEETLKVFNEEKQRNNRIMKQPILPIKTHVNKIHFDFLEEIFESGGTAILGGVLGFLFIMAVYTMDTGLFSIKTVFIFILIGAVLAVLIKIMVKYSLSKSSKESEAEKKYRSEVEQYNKDNAAYEMQRKVDEVIEDAIQENETTYTRVQATLKKLYSMEILYSSFRNMIAVHQIRQYLEMGICDTLEGPTGAYAEYMKDVRTQRICDSIQSMKTAMLGALNQIAANQQLLYQEMRQVNENVAFLQNSVENGLRAIQGEVTRTRNAVVLSNTAMHRQLEDLRKIMLASAQNQYIVQREQLANDWWERNRLQQP